MSAGIASMGRITVAIRLLRHVQDMPSMEKHLHSGGDNGGLHESSAVAQALLEDSLAVAGGADVADTVVTAGGGNKAGKGGDDDGGELHFDGWE
jgi:hypothetical protein